MCIVIDINTLSKVFNESDNDHSSFCCVKEWINSNSGFLVFGGTKYKEELKKAIKYLKIIRLLKDGGRAISIKDDVVYKLALTIIQKTLNTDCDDPHIIALLGASRCSLLCSTDIRSFPFVKNKSLYPDNMPKVRIYSSARNKSLLKKSDPSSLSNVDHASFSNPSTP